MTEATTPVTATVAPITAVWNGRKPGIRQLLRAANWLTTPLLPEDFLGLVNPLWSAREVRGRVEAVEPKGIDTVTVVIRPGSAWASHQPGQYVRVGVDIDGVWHWRSYSLSSAPERPDGRITITVKAVAGGVVSQHLVRPMAPGRIVRLAGPSGGFVLPTPCRERLLFLTAGSGITPVMSMLRSLASRGGMPDVVLVHSAPTPGEVIFGAELRAMAARSDGLRLLERHTRTGTVARRFTVADLPDLCPDWSLRSTWACGPAAMLEEIQAHWRQAGLQKRLHVERFRPAITTGGGAGRRVLFSRSGREAVADGGTPLLEVGEAAGVLMPSGCRMGTCHSCLARLTCGRVRDLRTGHEHGNDELIQTCVSAAAGTVEIDL